MSFSVSYDKVISFKSNKEIEDEHKKHPFCLGEPGCDDRARARVVGLFRWRQQAAQGDPFANIKRIQTAKVLKVGTGAGYYPFEMLDKSGKIVGFDMDIAQAMADALGVELEVVDFKDFDAILRPWGQGRLI